MNATVDNALSLWGLTDAGYNLVAARENAVYKVETPTDVFALRLHRQEYRTNVELDSELHWMKAISDGGLSVPSPIPSKTGDVMHMVDGVQVDVLDWLSGDTLDAVLIKSDAKTRVALFQTLGQDMARLHDICDTWQRPLGFSRCAWDIDSLLGDAPLWDRFWDNPGLTAKDRYLFHTFRHKTRTDLADSAKNLDYGLIHADLVAANVMVDGTGLHFIDFDDGGYGYRVFELATALLKHIDAPDYGDLKQALICGYTSTRPIDLATLDLFMALRATTYVGWNITRMGEDGGGARNTRFINTATKLAADYIG
ncbi:phosphotransferase enzyme family protein [Phaeobacter porticola]|uniref:Homoserine kinase n=1 Tax=Phaeobacter porticola TaxID=1844006 RepID=A0A1L3IAZ1_9RHOB|nr:phosphotransferase [Phaeobacter porticola]APG49244.1 homoserine kinase [Phaeobacter porticola]